MIKTTALASGSSGNCYKIDDGTTSLLIEAGIPITKIKQGLDYSLSDIEGCLVTHEHGDHSKAVNDLMKAGIDVYTSKGTIEALGVTGHRVHPVKIRQRYDIGSWIIKPLKAEHDATDPINYLIWSRETKEKLVYLTDTYYTRYIYHNLNYIMVECNHSYEILNDNIAAGKLHPAMKKRLIQSHFSLENVKDFLRANDLSQVREIWLIHLSDGNSNAAQFKREIQELTGKPVYIAGGD